MWDYGGKKLIRSGASPRRPAANGVAVESLTPGGKKNQKKGDHKKKESRQLVKTFFNELPRGHKRSHARSKVRSPHQTEEEKTKRKGEKRELSLYKRHS